MRIEKGDLIIDIRNLLSGMTGDARRELIQALACEDSVMADVADQIITGWTSSGWSAGRACSWSVAPWCALDTAIRRVAEASSEVAKKEIERANREIERLKKELTETETKLSNERCASSELRHDRDHFMRELERYKTKVEDCVCHETSTRNCRVHQNGGER